MHIHDQTAQRGLQIKNKLAGKKTYAFLGSAVAAVAISVAARHGLDLGDYGPDIAAGVGALLLAGATWARSVASPTPIDEQDRITPRP